jgi:hypothetical protein
MKNAEIWRRLDGAFGNQLSAVSVMKKRRHTASGYTGVLGMNLRKLADIQSDMRVPGCVGNLLERKEKINVTTVSERTFFGQRRYIRSKIRYLQRRKTRARLDDDFAAGGYPVSRLRTTLDQFPGNANGCSVSIRRTARVIMDVNVR